MFSLHVHKFTVVDSKRNWNTGAKQMPINSGITYVTYTEEQVRQLLEESVRHSGGHKKWIYDHKISVSLPALRDILAHKSHVTNPTVLKALKLKKLVVYVEDDEPSA